VRKTIQSARTQTGEKTAQFPCSAADTASYLAALTAELARLARAQSLDMVAYLLEMAQLEAEQAVQDCRLRDFGQGRSPT
jgi:hypothetical protein